VAEQALGLLVDQHDLPARRHPHDGVWGELEKLLELPLRRTALGDITNCRGSKPAVLGVDRGKRDLSRELAAVLPAPKELQPGAHRSRSGLGEIALAVPRVGIAETFGYEHLHVLSEQVISRVAKERLGLTIDQDDLSLVIHPDNCVRRRLKELLEGRTDTQSGRYIRTT